MRQLFGRGYRAASVEMLAQWINAIHHWAGVKYAGALGDEFSAALYSTMDGSGEMVHEDIGSQEQACWRGVE